jgi:hypothetical protein
VKLLYKPLGLIVSVLGGLVAAKLFAQLWRLLPGTSDSVPESKDPGHGWKEIAVAAALQGAVYGGVKAIVDRAGARGFERATGTWPE